MQSFVIPSDPEGDDFRGMPMSEDYVGDPYIRVVTWLHLNPHGDDLEMQHRECLRYAKMDGGRFVVMKNETFYRPYVQRQPLSRQYLWAAAMAGMHTLEAQHKADRPNHMHLLKDDGVLAGFMQQTDFFRMTSDDSLAHGATKWVLANPGSSYIAYSYAATDAMGIKNLPTGKYDLLWFDCEKGRDVTQSGVEVTGGNTSWTKPAGFGAEVAVYVKQVAPTTNSAMTPKRANPIESQKDAPRSVASAAVSVLTRDDLQRHPLPGRVIQKAVGSDAASRSSRMTMGFARYSSASGPMEPHRHAEELVYILEVRNAWFRHGPGKDNLPNRVALKPGMVLHIPALEWHVFEYGTGGEVDIMFFYGQVDNIRPEEIVSK